MSAGQVGLEPTTLRFYEGKCQEKIFLQRAEPGKICGIQPRFAVTGGMTARPLTGTGSSPTSGRRKETAGFYSLAFPRIRNGFCRTARSRQGRAGFARRSGALTARTVLEQWRKRESQAVETSGFLAPPAGRR